VIRNEKHYVVWGLDTIYGEECKIIITDFTEIEVRAVTFRKSYSEKGVFLYSTIKIGLGKPEITRTGFLIGNCVIEMLYDHEGGLITVDFYFDPVHNKI
jgi:hypothetical protein